MNSELVWNKFSDKVRNFLLKRVDDVSIADDLLQEVFLKIHLGLPKLKDDNKLENWVFQIAYNQVNDFFRKESKSKIESLNEAVFEAELSPEHDLTDCLTPFIASLPEMYRQAILLSEVDGLKQQAVADKLNISLSGAKSRIQRGRELIKQHFVECCQFHLDDNGKLRGEHKHRHESWNCEDDDCLVHS